MSKFVPFVFIGVLFLQSALAESLTISYLERPPYYFTKEGQPQGFLIDKTRQILRQAKIAAVFQNMPPKRIMAEIREGRSPHCSVGWYKIPGREAYARFSRAIYQSRPHVVLFRKADQKVFQNIRTTYDLFGRSKIKLISLSDFSYGPYLDQQIQKLSPLTQKISGRQRQLALMIFNRPRQYMLIVPEEIKRLIASAHLPEKEFQTLTLQDIQEGNKRYLMCNRAVTDQMMKRLNHAIRQLFP